MNADQARKISTKSANDRRRAIVDTITTMVNTDVCKATRLGRFSSETIVSWLYRDQLNDVEAHFVKLGYKVVISRHLANFKFCVYWHPAIP